jgi:GrpB-like predicted nucleotidyltransferase (UPF0157 family)
LRIDHIGSTAVPGLDAKDIIDVQVTVGSLSPAEPLIAAIQSAGYLYRDDIHGDHPVQGRESSPSEWEKLYFAAPPGQRRINVHVRVAGRANQRYALLFRDYLRTHPVALAGYAEVKRQLARYHPDDWDAYYDVKDPVCDIVMAGAEDWAAATGWSAGDDGAFRPGGNAVA